MSEIDEKIKNTNKEIAKNIKSGVLKIGIIVLPFLLSSATLGAGIWGEVKSAELNKAYKAYKSDESFLAAQVEEDIKITNQYQNGEINVLQYKEAQDYLQSEEFFQNFMSKDEQFQSLLKQKKLFEDLSFGGIFAGSMALGFSILGVVLANAVTGIKLDGFKEAKMQIEFKKKKLLPLKRNELLNKGNASGEQIEDLEDEFYKKD